LEVLETLGVPVLAFGQDELPAFWSRSSGLEAPMRVDSVADIVTFMQAREALQMGGGVLIANPVPGEHEIPRDQMQGCIAQALRDSQAAGITGKAVTPWLLNHLVQLTEGRSLVTNQALITDNARLAAELATALATVLPVACNLT
jgi:pseudouridine-5'-phosphate glycosidase